MFERFLKPVNMPEINRLARIGEKRDLTRNIARQFGDDINQAMKIFSQFFNVSPKDVHVGDVSFSPDTRLSMTLDPTFFPGFECKFFFDIESQEIVGMSVSVTEEAD